MFGVFLQPDEEGEGWWVKVVNGGYRSHHRNRKNSAKELARQITKAEGLPLFEEIVL